MGFLDKLTGKKDTQASAGPSAMVKDVVCGMTIAPTKAAGTSAHGKDTFYFCSAGCKAKFDKDPHHYLGAHAH